MRKFIIPLASALVLALSCEKALEVDDRVMVTSVSVDRPSAEVLIGETVQLSATVLPSDATDQSITWSSSNKEVATVSNNGLVTGVAEGRAGIMAKAGGKTSTSIVTVSRKPVPVTSVTLDKESITLTKGESKTLVATVKPDGATYKALSWTSSDSNVASVDSKGKVTALAIGSATITVKADDHQANCVITVVVPIQSITLNKSELTLTKGQSETLVATLKPEDTSDNTVTWSSSNQTVATVDSNGKVTAVGGGKATITAKAGGKSASCVVTVEVPVESISLNRTSITLGEGESISLKATLNPKDATAPVTWSSSDESIATVNQYGEVNAIRAGVADIVAKAGNKQATCVVTVIKKVTSVSLDKNHMTLLVGNSSSLTVTILPDDATDKSVTWRSNNTNVATVENGIVKGVGVGTSTITATVGNVSATCSVLVVLDSADGVSARFHGGQFEMVDGVVKAGGDMVFGVRNFSSETIHVVSVQLIDSQTGAATDALSIDSDLNSGTSDKWTIPVGDSDIHNPRARFVYTFREESYTCEAEITPL